MGSDAHVIVLGAACFVEFARARIDQLEALWSRFIPGSEISMLNAEPGVARRVSPETLRLVRRARDGWRETGGRFDPTVLGDVIRAGYDRNFPAVVIRRSGGVSLLERNASGIRIDEDACTVTLPSNAGFDPGGVGKGLAADVVVEDLLAAGAIGACVNIGGDLRVAGEGPDGGRWVIGVEDPAGESLGLVALASGGVATSTTVKRSWTVGDERRNHLIDPATGASLDREAIAVTALARDAASAEIAAKHALLAPPGGSIDALQELGCDGLVVTDDGDVRRTRGFDRFAIDRDASGPR
jgi:FAD:protein FMN transferase